MIVLCDIAGVLVRFDDAITVRQLQVQGVAPDKAFQFYRSIEFQDFCRGHRTAEAYVEALNKKYFLADIPLVTIQQAHDQHFYALNNEVVQILTRIPKNQLAIITDSNVWQEARIKEFIQLDELSSVIFQSHHTGLLKTDPGCFEEVVKALGVPASEIALIDDLVKNIERAKAAGMQTVLFESAPKLEKDLSYVL